MLSGLIAGIVDSQSAGFTTRWTVAGDVTARTITLPLVNSGGAAYNCTVNWGDGTASTITAYNDVNRSHTYASDGTYDVEIRGTCEGWSFNNGGDKLKVTRILFWGDRPTFGGFKYLDGAFYGCANCTSLGYGKIPVSGDGPTSLGNAFRQAKFSGQLPTGFLDNCTAVTNLSYCFYGNSQLQLSPYCMYADGDQATRFLGKAMNFASCFVRFGSYTGSQGTAPDIWNCDFGETITLDVAPATDWVGGDVITGQNSGATALVVAKVSALVYKIKQHFGTFALDEVVGVTGDSTKLADQGAGKPTFTRTPVSTGCFSGHSIDTVSNYADIPAYWK